jgi:2,4'-dihydroxyacetophenone dioxygenase
MIYVDPMGEKLGYEDVFTKIDMYKRHYEAVSLGADYVQRYVR